MFTLKFLEVLSSEFMCTGLLHKIRWAEGVYCPHCGSRRSSGEDGPTGIRIKKTCPACRREVDETAKKCEHCGYEFL